MFLQMQLNLNLKFVILDFVTVFKLQSSIKFFIYQLSIIHYQVLACSHHLKVGYTLSIILTQSWDKAIITKKISSFLKKMNLILCLLRKLDKYNK